MAHRTITYTIDANEELDTYSFEVKMEYRDGNDLTPYRAYFNSDYMCKLMANAMDDTLKSIIGLAVSVGHVVSQEVPREITDPATEHEQYEAKATPDA